MQKQKNKMVRKDDGVEGAKLDVTGGVCDSGFISMTVGVES